MAASMRMAPPLLALALACVAGTAEASVVYDQPSSGAACNTSCWTSAYAEPDGGYQSFDDFTLGASAAITTVTWVGFYYDYLNGAANPVTPPTQSWYLQFWGDAGGLPGSPLYADNLSAAAVSATLLGVSDFGGDPVNLYSFSANLDYPFYAAAGVTYWFSPVSEQPNLDPFFSWSPAAVDVDGVTAQAVAPSGAPYARPNDRAFSLSDAQQTGVPEPAAWALMLAGMGAVGGALREPRRAVRSPGRAPAMS
jgi:hypothetical protein